MEPDMRQSTGGTKRSPDIETLRNKYESLRDKKIALEANLATSQRTLDSLKRQANEKYGTDDVAVLREKLEEMRRENERKLQDYQEHLTAIENQLVEVEAKADGVADEEPET